MKKFRLRDQNGEDVCGEVGEDNVYISTYGSIVSGKLPAELEVDEFCIKEYSLSGQKKTRYWLVRTQ